MLKIFIDGNDDSLRLENPAGRKIGWIRDHTLGFGGFTNEQEAVSAAVDAWRSFDKTLQRIYPGRTSRPVRESNVTVVHDGAYEWIADGTRPIARLLRPRTLWNFEDLFALEFLAPSYATQHVTIAAAQAMWDVLSAHVTADTPHAAPAATGKKHSTIASRTLAWEGI